LQIQSNVQLLDPTFTKSDIPNQVGKTPALAPDFLWKGGVSFRKEQCFNIMLSAVYVSEQFWSDANISASPFPGAPPTPAKLPAYHVLDLSSEYYITKNVAYLQVSRISLTKNIIRGSSSTARSNQPPTYRGTAECH
jgi:hypothetical protein